jgi:DNA invertase Pin-like site-specific DNA recombinase
VTVTRVDRLARSISDLQDIVRQLQGKGVALKAIEQPIDTSTSDATAFLTMLSVFAEFDADVRRQRRLEGVAAAKAKGAYKGRPGKIKAADIAELKTKGLGATAIAKRLGISHASVYRVGWSPERCDLVKEVQIRDSTVTAPGGRPSRQPRQAR